MNNFKQRQATELANICFEFFYGEITATTFAIQLNHFSMECNFGKEDTNNMVSLCQIQYNREKIAEKLLKEYTAFHDFQELCTAKGGYRPSIRCETGLSNNKRTNKKERKELFEIAETYDIRMNLLSSEKEAYRC